MDRYSICVAPLSVQHLVLLNPKRYGPPHGSRSSGSPHFRSGVTTKVAVKIRLKRLGKKFSAHYRVVVMDSRAKRDGRAIEEIGLYRPTEEPSYIDIKSDRAQYWLGVGAQPTEQVAALLKITGDWQKFKNIEGQEGTLRTKAPKEPFVAPEKKSVIVPEAITPKAKKEEAEAASTEAEAE